MESLESVKTRLAQSRHAFLCGTLQDENPISLLRGNRYVLEDMFQMVEQPEYDLFRLKNNINRKGVPFVVWPRPCRPANLAMTDKVEMTRPIVFPTPQGININMMPIYLGFSLFSSLPASCKQYADFIWSHCHTQGWSLDENGNPKQRIGYLTIHEGLVPVGQTQRRPGLHIERPGAIKCNGKWHDAETMEYGEIAWGRGCWNENGLPEDGIYMASTVDDSCAIWSALIDNPDEVSDKHGGVENLRHLLGEPYKLKANELCWFTDRTPHESLPLQAPKMDQDATHVYRQFFRLVVGPISVWYAKHNTANPLGIQPDCPISDDDKFDDHYTS